MNTQYLDLSDEVKSAIVSKKPVVALESTIISHGMPYPKNVKTAKEVEAVVRSEGAVPATIAILNGRLKAGLTDTELDYLGKEKGVLKVSRRDLPYVISRKLDGATTVAATMIIAELAGISVFVTGGIGGVHRGAAESFDISADLIELSKTNVAVVCAGVKSILDIGATLEYLETQGVPVFGFESDEFPAFYSRNSGYNVDYRFDSPQEIAMAIKAKWDLGLKGGAVIANPIPVQHELEKNMMDAVIDQALIEADKQRIKGKDTTPFLLAKVVELTGAKSLEANIQLVLNNARIGAKIANAFNALPN